MSKVKLNECTIQNLETLKNNEKLAEESSSYFLSDYMNNLNDKVSIKDKENELEIVLGKSVANVILNHFYSNFKLPTTIDKLKYVYTWGSPYTSKLGDNLVTHNINLSHNDITYIEDTNVILNIITRVLQTKYPSRGDKSTFIVFNYGHFEGMDTGTIDGIIIHLRYLNDD